jgi:hypothetical protein
MYRDYALIGLVRLCADCAARSDIVAAVSRTFDKEIPAQKMSLDRQLSGWLN